MIIATRRINLGVTRAPDNLGGMLCEGRVLANTGQMKGTKQAKKTRLKAGWNPLRDCDKGGYIAGPQGPKPV